MDSSWESWETHPRMCPSDKATYTDMLLIPIILSVTTNPILFLQRIIGGEPPYFWSRVNGTLPNGLILNQDGVLEGIPTEGGNFTFTVEVMDSNNSVTDKIFVKEVYISMPPAQLKLDKWGATYVPGRNIDFIIVLQNLGIVPQEFVTAEIL